MAAYGRRIAPYAGAVVELTAAPPDPRPYPLWIRPLTEYERRERSEFSCSRFG